MSLLMEALRKAEEAKRRMQQEEQAAAGQGAREAAEFPPARGPRNDSPFTLEEREPAVTPEYIRDNFTAQPAPAAPEPQPALQAEAPAPYEPAEEPEAAPPAPADSGSNARNLARRQQRATAASVFAAKQNPARNRKTVTILVGVMLLMIPLGGGVLWYLQSLTPSSIFVNPSIANYDLASRGSISDTPPAAPAATAAAADPAAAASASTAAGATSVTEQTATPEADVAAEASEAEAASPDAELAGTETAAEAQAGQPAVAVTEAPPAPVPAAAPAAIAGAQADPGLVLPDNTPAPVLEVSRSRATSQVNPDLVAAYTRLQAGDLPVAGQLYQDVLAAFPNNRDALLGLALVRMRQGQPVSSRELYARLLQLNPRDPLAHTGLLQTMQVADPAEHEVALKKLIADYPDVAQLTLALGNLYASQQRWSEAQAAYYNALLIASRGTNGPVHPDYAFNLAVSLEQLNQPRAALDYYRQAQTLAAQITPGFDPQLLNSRLDYLSTQAQP